MSHPPGLRRRTLLQAAAAGSLPAWSSGQAQERLPIFDAHVHYSDDAWANLPPREAIAILRKAGLSRALVSSSGDEGTQRLAMEAPDLVLRALRAYAAQIS